MARVTRPGWVPKYRLHKRSGLAYVGIAGRDIFLGTHGSEQSRAEYNRIIAEWLAGARLSAGTSAGDLQARDLTVAELILAFWKYAEPLYPPKSLSAARSAFRPLRALYGHTRIAEFRPMSLRALQNTLAEKTNPNSGRRVYCRKTINDYTARIRQLFKWGVADGLVPAPVWQALLAVPGLRYGRTPARESRAVGPAPDANVEAVLPHLPPMVADMVMVQRLTGARPGEICDMTAAEFDMSGPVWMYTPRHHKTAHHGKARAVAIGPRAQAILRKYLTNEILAPLFSPEASEEERRRLLRGRRKTPMTPSQLQRDAEHDRNPRDDYRDAYPPAAYAKAVHRACRRAGVPAWSPNQLRHSRATEIRKSHGLDAAGAVLGHSKLETTQIYAERSAELAMKMAQQTG